MKTKHITSWILPHRYVWCGIQGESVSAAQIMAAIHEPLAIVQGKFPNNVVTTTRIPQTYLNIASALELPTLKSYMTLANFKTCTKLDLSINLKK